MRNRCVTARSSEAFAAGVSVTLGDDALRTTRLMRDVLKLNESLSAIHAKPSAGISSLSASNPGTPPVSLGYPPGKDKPSAIMK